MMTLLDDAIGHAGSLRALLERGEPAEIVAFEIQTLIETVASITGEISPDDVLNSVFSRFCIGK
jgi:tRNA modification GTPase